MRAIVQRRYGSVDELELRNDVEPPIARAGEVLVRVRAASLHPDIWHVVAGRPAVLRVMGGGFLRPKDPIPGTDMAGVVEAVGPGVTRFRVGDPVFGETRVREAWANGAAYAELVAVPEALLARKPERVSFEQAASVPASGTIALQNLRDVERTGPGRRVLVNGAAGGVGAVALQVLKARGAHVTAVDAASKHTMLRTLGADEVMDHRREDFTARGERYDLIFDVPADRPWADIRRALAPDGRYVMIGHDHFGAAGRATFGLIPHFVGMMARSLRDPHLRAPRVPRPTKPQAIAELRDRLEAGTLTPVIDSAHALEDFRPAFRRMIDEEPCGKVVLRITQGDASPDNP